MLMLLRAAYMYDEGEGTRIDEIKAAQFYLKAPNGGNLSSQYNLALMYDNGEGVKLDDERARFWYKSAVRLKAISTPNKTWH